MFGVYIYDNFFTYSLVQCLLSFFISFQLTIVGQSSLRADVSDFLLLHAEKREIGDVCTQAMAKAVLHRTTANVNFSRNSELIIMRYKAKF